MDHAPFDDNTVSDPRILSDDEKGERFAQETVSDLGANGERIEHKGCVIHSPEPTITHQGTHHLFNGAVAPGVSEKKSTAGKFSAEAVESVFQKYPRHIGKADALKAIAKALVTIASRKEAPADPVEWLTERVVLFASSPAGKRGQYTKHPATWFNKGCFDDDTADWMRLDQPDANAEPAWRVAKRAREYPEPDLLP